MNRGGLILLALGMLLAGLLIGLGLGLIFAGPAISLATDKASYTLGESVVFFGRVYGFAGQLVKLDLFVDEYFSDGTIRNALLMEVLAVPVNWDFEVDWFPPHTGSFTAYMIGPGHVASAPVNFVVITQNPIPEFDSTLSMLLVTTVMVLAAVAIQRRAQLRKS